MLPKQKQKQSPALKSRQSQGTNKKGRKLFVFSEKETKSMGVRRWEERLVVLEGWGKTRGGITEEGASELDLNKRTWGRRVSKGI